LLPSCDIDLVRLNAAGLKQMLLPWALARLSELQQMLPVLAAGERADLRVPQAQRQSCWPRRWPPGISSS
jgi:hypothetical protein